MKINTLYMCKHMTESKVYSDISFVKEYFSIKKTEEHSYIAHCNACIEYYQNPINSSLVVL